MKKRNPLKKLFSLIIFIKRYSFFLFHEDSCHEIGNVDVIMMSGDADKMTKVQGKYFDRILDFFAFEFDRVGLQWAHLAHPPAKIYGKKTFSNSYTINRSYIVALLFDLVHGITDQDEQLYKRNSRLVKIYKNFFINSMPKVVLTINARPEILIAAQSLSIPVVEVLHGKGYTSDPKIWLAIGQKRNIFPDYVISYDSTSTKTLERNAKNLKVIESFDPSFEKYSELSLKESSFFEDKKTTIKVLLSLTWGYGGEIEELHGILQDGILPNGLIEAVGILGSTVKWTIRLHPVQMTSGKKLYRKQRKYLSRVFLKYPNVKLESEPGNSIYKSLELHDVHISFDSMSVYEAAQMGKTSYLIAYKINDDKYSDLIDLGYVKLIQDRSIDICNAILDQEVNKNLKGVELQKSTLAIPFVKMPQLLVNLISKPTVLD